MDRNTKKAIRMVNNSLDKIYATAVSISKSLEFKMIHITVLNELIQKSKIGNDSDMPVDFVKNYNILLDELFNVCKEHMTKSKLVHPDVLRRALVIVKKSI